LVVYLDPHKLHLEQDLSMKILKTIFFFVLLPIYGPLYAFMNYTFKWWEGLLE